MNEDLGEQRIDWPLTRAVLEAVSNKDLHRLARLVNREKRDRWEARQRDEARYRGAMIGMANAMAGVTWALACRNSLRASKGHTPPGGKCPQSGEMWMPRELLYAARAEVKERGWSPLTAACWSDVQSHLQAEAKRKPVPEPDDIYATAFRVRFARADAATRSSL